MLGEGSAGQEFIHPEVGSGRVVGWIVGGDCGGPEIFPKKGEYPIRECPGVI